MNCHKNVCLFLVPTVTTSDVSVAKTSSPENFTISLADDSKAHFDNGSVAVYNGSQVLFAEQSFNRSDFPLEVSIAGINVSELIDQDFEFVLQLSVGEFTDCGEGGTQRSGNINVTVDDIVNITQSKYSFSQYNFTICID